MVLTPDIGDRDWDDQSSEESEPPEEWITDADFDPYDSLDDEERESLFHLLDELNRHDQSEEWDRRDLDE